MERCWVTFVCIVVFATSIRSAVVQTSTTVTPTEQNSTTVTISHPNSSTAVSVNTTSNATAPSNNTTNANATTPTTSSSTPPNLSISSPVKLDNPKEAPKNLPRQKEAASSSHPSDSNTTKSVSDAVKVVPLVAKPDVSIQNLTQVAKQAVPTHKNAPSIKLGPTSGKIMDDPKFDRLTDERNSIESSLYSTKVALGFFVTFTLALLIGSVFMYRRMRRLREEDRTVFSSTSYGDLRNDNYDLAL